MGLYVGLDEQNMWKTPSSFNKQQYKEEEKYTRLLKLHFENAIDITNFMIELGVRGPLTD